MHFVAHHGAHCNVRSNLTSDESAAHPETPRVTKPYSEARWTDILAAVSRSMIG